MAKFLITYSVPELQFDLNLLRLCLLVRLRSLINFYVDFYLSECGTYCSLELVLPNPACLGYLKDGRLANVHVSTEDYFRVLHLLLTGIIIRIILKRVEKKASCSNLVKG